MRSDGHGSAPEQMNGAVRVVTPLHPAGRDWIAPRELALLEGLPFERLAPLALLVLAVGSAFPSPLVLVLVLVDASSRRAELLPRPRSVQTH